jgi:hypothetical protein
MTRRKGGFPVLVVGLAAGMALGRRLASERRVPNLDVWQRTMAEGRGEMEAARLAARVRERYEELYVGRPHFAQPALRFHLEQVILPGLALYQVLREYHDDQDAALDEVQALLKAAYAPLGKGMVLLRHAPGHFGLFRRLTRRLVALGFPAAGWELDWIQDDDQAVAFDVRRCIYLEVLTGYDAPELAQLFCWVDDLVFAELPAWISWERTGTLARGDGCCDFRWANSSASEMDAGAAT